MNKKLQGHTARGLTDQQELVARRTLRGKWFQTSPNTFRVISTVGLLHYEQDGQLVDLDTTPRWTGPVVQPTATPYQATFNTNTLTLTYTSVEGGTLVATLLSVGGVPPTTTRLPVPDGHSKFRVQIAPDVVLEGRFYAEGLELFRRILSSAGVVPIVWQVTESVAQTPTTNFLAMTGRDSNRRLVEMAIARSEVTIQGVSQHYTVTELVTGRVRHIDPVTRARTWETDLAFPLLLDVTVKVTYDTDDGHSNATNFYIGSSGYVYFDTTYDSAFRFRSVNVPQGTVVDDATLSINVLGTGNVTGVLYGQDVDDAPVWADASANSVDAMTKTTATTTFNGLSSTGVKNFNVKTIVDEIFARAGWVANNSIRLGADQTAGTTGVNIEDISQVGVLEAQLVINFTAGGAASPLFRGS